MSNIRNAEDYTASFWNWSIFNNCFGETAIRMTDVDGMVERKGRFLILETKKPTADVPFGQAIMFDALNSLGCFTIYVVWGNTDKPERIMRWGTDRWQSCDAIDLVEIVSQWFEWANKRSSDPFEYIQGF